MMLYPLKQRIGHDEDPDRFGACDWILLVVALVFYGESVLEVICPRVD